MKISSAEFLCSNTDISKCPPPEKPEFAFIGRSNVGKSSLINLLTDNSKLAKTSSKPGKTQLINHFLINNEWYLVDLPGYGYAKTSKSNRRKWHSFINDYLLHRPNLQGVFVLIDSRIPPQPIDLEFMQWLGKKQIPFVMVFTKIDKLSSNELNKNLKKYKQRLAQEWNAFPKYFLSSTVSKLGKDEILDFIDQVNQSYFESIKNQ
jgi:GTP-binding protein